MVFNPRPSVSVMFVRSLYAILAAFGLASATHAQAVDDPIGAPSTDDGASAPSEDTVASVLALDEVTRPIIERARAAVADEATLKGIRSLIYEGEIRNREGERIGSFTLRVLRPHYYKTIMDNGETVTTTAVSDFEGYTRMVDADKDGRSAIRVLEADRVELYQASARENLNFFLGPQTVEGGEIALVGEAIKMGRPAYKVRFAYPSGVYYIRYFDREDGRLLSTVVGAGRNEIVEKAHRRISGIRIPVQLENLSPDGHVISTIIFDSVVVNPGLERSEFDMPETLGKALRRR